MTDQKRRIQFFLGANSPQGFASFYPEWIEQETASAFYIIKGGAGCGKSTLMTHVAEKLEAEGYAVEYICCSGDPDSIDGIAIPRKAAAMADGTAPHVLDPAYPGAVGHYLNLGDGYDRGALFPLRQQIIDATQAYQACYPDAYRCIRAAAAVRRSGQTPLWTPEALEKARKRAERIANREIKEKKERRGKVSRRFLSGITCQGKLFYGDTVAALCSKVYQIQDKCGLADAFLAYLEERMIRAGYDVVSCLSPEQPDRREHLLIPELSLAFVTQWEGEPPLRVVSTETMVEKNVWQERKNAVKFANRIADEILDEGIAHLQDAKNLHDALEALYHPYVDFSLCEALAEKTAVEILALPDLPSTAT